MKLIVTQMQIRRPSERGKNQPPENSIYSNYAFKTLSTNSIISINISSCQRLRR